MVIQCVDIGATSRNLTITNAAQGQATTLTMPDSGGAAANFVLSEGTATINGAKTFGSNINIPGILGTDATLDDSILLPFLPGSIDETLFAKLYGIDHGRLVAGGQELLSQSGDLGQALFSAAVGTAGLREILSELQNGAEDLYKPRASTKLVNQAIARFKEAQKRIKDSSLPVAEWKGLQKKLADTRYVIKQIEDNIDEKSKEKSRQILKP